MSVIIAEKLSKRYGQRRGVEEIDLQIDAGELFGFLGPNGAGKTTTIRLLLGFLRASRGRAAVLGLDSWRQSAQIKRDVGYLPGDVRLYPWLNAQTALQIFSQIRGRELRDYGPRLAERFGLEMTVPVRKMSRGTRQKLGLVLTLAHRPRVLVLDEPTSGLDPLMQVQLADYLREQARDGRTVFFSSHTLSEVEQLCDRVAIVRSGRVVADETLDALRRRARRAVTLVFKTPELAHHTQPPSFLDLCQRDGKRWFCELPGHAAELVRWMATQPIEDVAIGTPNLESLFRQFYSSAG